MMHAQIDLKNSELWLLKKLKLSIFFVLNLGILSGSLILARYIFLPFYTKKPFGGGYQFNKCACFNMYCILFLYSCFPLKLCIMLILVVVRLQMTPYCVAVYEVVATYRDHFSVVRLSVRLSVCLSVCLSRFLVRSITRKVLKIQT